MFFAFEEQSCLILDSIFNPLFKLQILDSICRFYVLGLPIFYIELNEDSQTELNKYNKNESVLKWELNWLLTYVNSEQCYILQGRPGGGGGGSGIPVYLKKIRQNTQKYPEFIRIYPKLYPGILYTWNSKWYTAYPYLSCNIPYTRFKKSLYTVYPKTLANPDFGLPW